MELKEGYKQTEVGVIPEEWEVKTFGEIFSYLSTATNSRNELSEEAGVYYIHYGDIHTKFHNHLNIEKDKPPTIDRNKCRNAALIKNGDWVMADASEDYDGVGKTIEVFGLQDGEQAVAGLHTFLLREKCPVFVPRFKGHLGCLKSLHEEYLRVATGMKVFGVSKSALVDLHLPVPTKAEQEAIAEALSDADALIESLEQLIAKKRQIKQGAMQELLTGKKRLPGFNGEWEVKTFGEVFTYLPTATNSRNDLLEDGEAYYIHYGDIHTKFHNHLDFTATKPPMIDRSRCRNAALIKNGDWVMADASEDYDGVGKTIEITGLEEGQEAVAGLHTFLLREKSPTFVPGFKGHLGGLKALHEEYLRVATGMKVYGVSKTALVDLELPVPHSDEQTAIATILSDMDAEIAALETKLAKARQVKQGMMQELLTGNIRLVQPEKAHA